MKIAKATTVALAAFATTPSTTLAQDVATDDAKLLQEMQDAHPLWLRERCSEKVASADDATENLRVLKVKPAQGGFVAQFSDKHECFYAKDFILLELSPDGDSNSNGAILKPLTPELFLWDSKLVAPASYERDEIVDRSDNTRKFLSNLLSTGVARVQNVENQCDEFASFFTAVQETEKGKTFAFENAATVPRTHVESGVHARQGPPDFVALHAPPCEKETDSHDCNNGFNRIVDGFAVAEALCRQDRPLFDVLHKVVLRWESNRYAPILQVEEEASVESTSSCPTVKTVNFPPTGGFAPKLAKEELDLFYKAKQTFSDMVQSDEFKVDVKLDPGEMILLDNHRVLHSFSDPTDGTVQACYLDRNGLVHLHDKLKREYASMTETPFRNLKGAVKADFDRMGVEYDEAVVKKTKDKLIAILEDLKDSYLGQPVSLYEHNVQTASRALRGGEDDETIFISLFHDVFETLGVKNHGELIAAMLAPWISPSNHWMLAHHEVFQGYYYFEDYGIDKNKRDMYKNHPAYNQTVDWCEKYDQASFDPDYPSLPLSTFIPAIERVLARPQYWWNPAHPKAGAVSSASEFQNFDLGKPVSECPDTWQCYEAF